MSDGNETESQTPEGSKPEGGEGGSDTPPKPTTPEGKARQWDGEFDPERAARLIENLRKENAALKAAKPDEKSLQDRLAALEEALSKSERKALVAQAAKAHNLPDDLLEFISGDSEEDINRKAEALAKFAKAPAEEVPGRPKPRLKPGTGGDDGEPFDPKAVAKAIKGD